MAGIDGLIQEAIQRMYQQATTDSIKELQQYQIRLQNVQAKIKAFKKLENSGLLSDMQIDWKNSDQNFLTDYYKSEASATKIMEADTYRIAYGKALLDGYHVLTEFGSYIRQSGEVQYSVTATGGSGMSTYKITWTDMPFEQFANLINFNVGQHIASANSTKHIGGQAVIEGLRLKGVAKLFKSGLDDTGALGQLIASGNVGSIKSWNQTEIQLYNAFVKRAKNLKTDGKKKWYRANEGNFLEAFTRFLEATNGNIPINSKGKLSTIASDQIRKAMQETMSNPGAFYTGGDIGNLQLKGNSATIAQSSTIEEMINSVQQLLSTIISLAYSSTTSQGPPSGISSDINAAIEKNIKDTIEQLIVQFFHT